MGSKISNGGKTKITKEVFFFLAEQMHKTRIIVNLLGIVGIYFLAFMSGLKY